jgi:hypothetical protein
MSESYNEKYNKYLKEKNSLHYKMRAKGGYLYCCSSKYPNDYYDMCNSIWYKYFQEYNPKITSAKNDYNKYMSMTYMDFREARESGRMRLRQPNIDKPKGVEINLDGYTATIKDWEDIATAGGQYDSD